MKQRKLVIFLVIAMLWSISSIASAQGGVIAYGETRSDILTDASPQLLYSLNGNENEVVTVYILSGSDTFQPSITILGPTGQIAFETSDRLSPIFNDARATLRLPATGSYSVLVGSANNVFGPYTIAVRLTTPGISTQLGAEPVILNIPPGGQSQSFTLAPSASDTPLTIASSSPGFMFAAQVSAPDGRVVMAIDGALPSVTAILPASTEPYTVVVSASNPNDSGTITIAQTGDVIANTGAIVPVVTEEVGNTDTPPTDQCTVTAGAGGVNIRSGPGTDYATIGGLAANAYLVVTGQNNGWYTGSTVYGQGWMAGSVVTLAGPCANLPFMDAPPLPTATTVPSTATYIPTTDNTDNTGEPTATYTPTATPTETTENVDIAPVDNDGFNLVADRDTGGQFSNDVSYPDGDTSDRVRITLDGLTNNPPNAYREISILVTCFGDGAENLTWGTGGPTSPSTSACNQSLSAVHTNDSNQTYVNINMNGAGHVNYTIIVSITG